MRKKNRGYNESQGEGKMQERREESKAEGEGEEYLSEGEDWRPCIKWRKKKTVRGIKEKIEIMEKDSKGHNRRRGGGVPV